MALARDQPGGHRGDTFQDGSNLTRDFRLNLAPQVVAIVPQPISRENGKLKQEVNQIEVYFNLNDPLNVASAQNTSNYQLIHTSDVDTANPTANTLDDVRFNPLSVTYDSNTGKATSDVRHERSHCSGHLSLASRHERGTG